MRGQAGKISLPGKGPAKTLVLIASPMTRQVNRTCRAKSIYVFLFFINDLQYVASSNL
jgi:hypothetical protein